MGDGWVGWKNAEWTGYGRIDELQSLSDVADHSKECAGMVVGMHTKHVCGVGG